MEILLRTDAKNSNQSAVVKIDSYLLFSSTEKEKEFLNSLTHDWKPVPAYMMDPTAAANFYYYVKLP